MKRRTSLNLSPIRGDGLGKGKDVAERFADADPLAPCRRVYDSLVSSWRVLLGDLRRRCIEVPRLNARILRLINVGSYRFSAFEHRAGLGKVIHLLAPTCGSRLTREIPEADP
jgi:hypothetical protein